MRRTAVRFFSRMLANDEKKLRREFDFSSRREEKRENALDDGTSPASR